MADVITGLQDDDIATEWRHERASASDDDGTDGGDSDGTDGGDSDGTDGSDSDGTDGDADGTDA